MSTPLRIEDVGLHSVSPNSLRSSSSSNPPSPPPLRTDGAVSLLLMGGDCPNARRHEVQEPVSAMVANDEVVFYLCGPRIHAWGTASSEPHLVAELSFEPYALACDATQLLVVGQDEIALLAWREADRIGLAPTDGAELNLQEGVAIRFMLRGLHAVIPRTVRSMQLAPDGLTAAMATGAGLYFVDCMACTVGFDESSESSSLIEARTRGCSSSVPLLISDYPVGRCEVRGSPTQPSLPSSPARPRKVCQRRLSTPLNVDGAGKIRPPPRLVSDGSWPCTASPSVPADASRASRAPPTSEDPFAGVNGRNSPECWTTRDASSPSPAVVSWQPEEVASRRRPNPTTGGGYGDRAAACRGRSLVTAVDMSHWLGEYGVQLTGYSATRLFVVSSQNHIISIHAPHAAADGADQWGSGVEWELACDGPILCPSSIAVTAMACLPGKGAVVVGTSVGGLYLVNHNTLAVIRHLELAPVVVRYYCSTHHSSEKARENSDHGCLRSGTPCGTAEYISDSVDTSVLHLATRLGHILVSCSMGIYVIDVHSIEPLQALGFHSGGIVGCGTIAPSGLCAMWSPFARMVYMLRVPPAAPALVSAPVAEEVQAPHAFIHDDASDVGTSSPASCTSAADDETLSEESEPEVPHHRDLKGEAPNSGCPGSVPATADVERAGGDAGGGSRPAGVPHEAARGERDLVHSQRPLPAFLAAPLTMKPCGPQKKSCVPDKPVTFGHPIHSSGYGTTKPWGVQQRDKKASRARRQERAKNGPLIAAGPVGAALVARDCEVPLQPLQAANRCVASARVHSSVINAATFDAMGQHLVTGSGDTGIYMMHYPPSKSGASGIHLDDHQLAVTTVDVSLSSSNPLVVSGCAGGHLALWQPLKFKVPISRLSVAGHEMAAARFFYMDRLLCYAAGERIYVARYTVGNPGGGSGPADLRQRSDEAGISVELAVLSGAQQVTAMDCINHFASDVLLWAGSNKALTVFDVNQQEPVHVYSDAHTRGIHAVAMMGGSSRFAAPDSGMFHCFLSAGMDSTVKLWDMRQPHAVRAFSQHRNTALKVGLALSPAGGILAIGSEERQVLLYDTRSGKSIEAHKTDDTPTALRFHPRSPHLFAGTLSGTMTFYTSVTG